MSDTYVTSGMRLALSRHVLTECVRARPAGSPHDADVCVFRMAEPGTRVMSVVLVFAAGRTFISGDLTISTNNGEVSALGYGLDWFAGRCGEDYLAEKFLRKRHVPALAVAGVRAEAASYFEDRLIEEPDERDREVKAALEEAAAQGEGGPCGPCGSSDELWELYGDLEIDTSDGVPGWGYDPREVGWLAAVQQRFAELYAAFQASPNLPGCALCSAIGEPHAKHDGSTSIRQPDPDLMPEGVKMGAA